MSKQLNKIKSVRTKILAGFAIVTVLTLVLGGVAITQLTSLGHDSEALYERGAVQGQNIADLREGFAQLRYQVLSHVENQDPAKWDSIEEGIQSQRQAIDAALAKYDTGNIEQQAIVQLQAALEDYDAIIAEVISADRAGDKAAIADLRAERVGPVTLAVADSVKALTDMTVEDAAAVNDDAQSNVTNARSIVLAILAAAVALAVLLGLFLARMIVAPLRRAVEVLGRVADGDLTQRLDVGSADEVGQMAHALNQTLERTGEAIGAIAESSVSLASSSEELSAVSQQLSASAEETSAQATTASAAAEQVSANVQTVASGAEQMGASIGEIASNASRGCSGGDVGGGVGGGDDGDGGEAVGVVGGDR